MALNKKKAPHLFVFIPNRKRSSDLAFRFCNISEDLFNNLKPRFITLPSEAEFPVKGCAPIRLVIHFGLHYRKSSSATEAVSEVDTSCRNVIIPPKQDNSGFQYLKI